MRAVNTPFEVMIQCEAVLRFVSSAREAPVRGELISLAQPLNLLSETVPAQ